MLVRRSAWHKANLIGSVAILKRMADWKDLRGHLKREQTHVGKCEYSNLRNFQRRLQHENDIADFLRIVSLNSATTYTVATTPSVA